MINYYRSSYRKWSQGNEWFLWRGCSCRHSQCFCLQFQFASTSSHCHDTPEDLQSHTVQSNFRIQSINQSINRPVDQYIYLTYVETIASSTQVLSIVDNYSDVAGVKNVSHTLFLVHHVKTSALQNWRWKTIWMKQIFKFEASLVKCNKLSNKIETDGYQYSVKSSFQN